MPPNSPSVYEAQKYPRKLVVTTATFYPNWYPGDVRDPEHDLEKVRGDLALQLLREAQAREMRTVVVDGAMNEDFEAAVRQIGDNIFYEKEREKGMSESRRQAFAAAYRLPGIEVIGWTEPEKVSMVTDDCFVIAAEPILQGAAEITVPSRYTQKGEPLFHGYPDYQRDSEVTANEHFNALLRAQGLLTNREALDMFIGPRLFTRRDNVFELFIRKYMAKSVSGTHEVQPDPELYSNALYYPIANALREDVARVLSVPVPFTYPAEQARIEELLQKSLIPKRRAQTRRILIELSQLLKLQVGDSKANLELAN